jgi:hypothetical protein
MVAGVAAAGGKHEGDCEQGAASSRTASAAGAALQPPAPLKVVDLYVIGNLTPLYTATSGATSVVMTNTSVDEHSDAEDHDDDDDDGVVSDADNERD